MNNTMNVIERLILLWKGDPWLKTGKGIFYMSLASISGIFPELTTVVFKIPISFASSISTVCTFIAPIGCLTGLTLVGLRYFKMNSNPPVLYYGQGMENMDDNPPVNALPLVDRGFARVEWLGSIDSYDKVILLKKLEYYGNLFEEKTKHKNAPKLYLAALGSFPYLFVLGSFLKNAHNTVRIVEHARNATGGNKWHLLDKHSDDKITHTVQGDENLPYMSAVKELNSNDSPEVGIALSYTFEIARSDLPEELRDSTIILETSLGHGIDKLSNESIQQKLLSELSVILNVLGKNRQRVHLFVSAQASMCINIGKCYQDNVHPELVLYSYTRDQGYNWSISYNQGKLS